MLRKSLLFSGLALAAMPAAVRAQLYVANGASLHIASGGVVAVTGGDVIALDNVTGSGQLILNGTTAQSLGGATGKSISPEVVISNPANVSLSAVTRLAGNLNFTNGKLVAGNNNLVFTSSGTSSGYGATANRYVVTNGTGFVTKEGLATGASFVFPIGRSLTAGDYNQAVLTNTATTTRDYNVQVKNKAESGVLSGNAAHGIDRFWNIYCSAGGTASVALNHKVSDANNAAFTHNSAFVTQQLEAGVWSLGTNTAATTPLYTHTNGFTVPTSSGITSMFSKSDDPGNSIPSKVPLTVKVFLEGPVIAANQMRTSLQQQSKLPVSSPYTAAPASYAAINNAAGVAGAVTDWIWVQVVNATNPKLVLQQKSLLLKSNGNIVDVDGEVPVFESENIDTRLVIRHRNHLPVVSNVFVQGTANQFKEGYRSYDFSTGVAQAYRLSTDPVQMVSNANLTPTVAMYTGESIQNDIINASDFSDIEAIYQNLDTTYRRQDLNLDGITNATDFSYIERIYSQLINSVLFNF